MDLEDEDAIPEDALEFNADADVNQVFVEPPHYKDCAVDLTISERTVVAFSNGGHFLLLNANTFI